MTEQRKAEAAEVVAALRRAAADLRKALAEGKAHNPAEAAALAQRMEAFVAGWSDIESADDLACRTQQVRTAGNCGR